MTAVLDCSSSGSVAVGGAVVAATTVVADVPAARQRRDAAADAVDSVSLSELHVTWSSLMEEW
jgi:hypothetical protein